MYPVHHPTLKIEQAERQADAALLRLAATAGGTRRRWWSLATWLGSAATTATPADPAMPEAAPIPEPGRAAPVTPAPATVGTADDDRVLVGH